MALILAITATTLAACGEKKEQASPPAQQAPVVQQDPSDVDARAYTLAVNQLLVQFADGARPVFAGAPNGVEVTFSERLDALAETLQSMPVPDEYAAWHDQFIGKVQQAADNVRDAVAESADDYRNQSEALRAELENLEENS